MCNECGTQLSVPVIERDPTGREAHDAGAKLDDGKILAGVFSDFSLALIEVAKAAQIAWNALARLELILREKKE